jgi:hypothetical protein
MDISSVVVLAFNASAAFVFHLQNIKWAPEPSGALVRCEFETVRRRANERLKAVERMSV